MGVAIFVGDVLYGCVIISLHGTACFYLGACEIVLKCLCGLLLWFGDEDIRGETALDRNINIALLLLLGKHIK